MYSKEVRTMRENKILRSKTYLYLTEFFSGVAVMAVELGASRLLAPYFSSSQIVWTIIIGTIMIAMALGNIWGGHVADKNPDPAILYRRMLVAAVWIAAIPVVGKYVILGVSGLLVLTVSTNFLIIAAFVSCIVIFVYPLFLLGTVTPSLVKYTVESLDDSGRTVGRMEACNTVGSILGTFLPTFVTIPAVGTSITFLIFGGVLLVLGLAYFLSQRPIRKSCFVALVLFLLCVLLGRSNSFAFWEKNLSYEGESIYNYLQVKEDDRKVVLSTNVLFGVQSVLQKDGKLTGMYYDYALAAPVAAAAEQDGPLDILVLGNATGTYAKQCIEYFPGCRVEGVEIDQAISDLAGQYFQMPESVKVTCYDGRAFLQVVDQTYDVILVDAYQDITIPFQMSTVEFFTLVKEHLSPGGVMAVNMNMHSEGEGSINQYLCDTISGVFDEVYTVDVRGTTNKELFAVVGGDFPGRLEAGISELEDPDLIRMMERVGNSLVPYEGGGLILTDDQAPVEMLGMKVIDSIITEELEYYKGIFKEEGIQGILNSF